MKKILFISLFILAPAFASASNFSGPLTTEVQTGVEGTVIVTPTASPIGGIYPSTQSVTLSAPGSSSIYYTTDGSTAPVCTSSTKYISAISVSASQVIQARSCYPNNASSTVATFAYAINPPSAPAPSGSGGSGGGGGGGGSVLPPPAVVGDATGDGIVNVLDFNAVLVAWGSVGTSLSGDLNRDGVVDILDFNILIINWTA